MTFHDNQLACYCAIMQEAKSNFPGIEALCYGFEPRRLRKIFLFRSLLISFGLNSRAVLSRRSFSEGGNASESGPAESDVSSWPILPTPNWKKPVGRSHSSYIDSAVLLLHKVTS